MAVPGRGPYTGATVLSSETVQVAADATDLSAVRAVGERVITRVETNMVP